MNKNKKLLFKKHKCYKPTNLKLKVFPWISSALSETIKKKATLFFQCYLSSVFLKHYWYISFIIYFWIVLNNSPKFFPFLTFLIFLMHLYICIFLWTFILLLHGEMPKNFTRQLTELLIFFSVSSLLSYLH